MISERERWTAILSFGIIFLIGYSLTGFLPHYSIFHAATSIDDLIPFVPAFIIVYFMGEVYPFVAFFLLQDERKFRRMVKGFFVVMGIAFACFIALPIEIPKDFFYEAGMLPMITHLWHTYDTTYNNFPSLHVAFTFYAWLIILSENKRMAWWTSPIAFGIVISVVLVKSHLFIDIIGGLVLATAVFLWYRSGLTSEKLDRPMV